MLKWLGFALVACLVAAQGVRSEEAAPKKEEAKTEAPKAEDKGVDSELMAKASYIIGLDIGSNFARNGVTLDAEQLTKGFKDASAGKAPPYTPQQMQEIIGKFQQVMMAKRQAEMQKTMAENAKLGEKHAADGKAFLDENKKKEGVQATASGLQYKVLKEGEGGDKPKETDQVTVHYKGNLLDGSEFDSSYKRNEPASFKLNEVIKGWTEGVQLMKTGSKYQFWIPSNLAYGEQGRPGIPPNAMLTFEVELLAIGAAKEPAK